MEISGIGEVGAVVAQALLLALVANRLVEAVVAPLKKRYAEMDFWWLIYAAWGLGGVLAWFAGVNLFGANFPDYEIVGRLLTAVVVGGGSNLIHDIFGGK